jgi:general stress protein 26
MTETADPRTHLLTLAKSFSTAMLVNRTADGQFGARPMAIAKVDDSGDVYFATTLSSPKVDELQADANVVLTFQNTSQFVTIEGLARIERDPVLIKDLWSETWRVWFPKGPTDPDLCLICVTATSGEFWDNGGMNGIKYLFSAAHSLFNGERPKHDGTQNAKVAL